MYAMFSVRKSWIDSLVNFSRLISEAAAPIEVFPLLAEAAVTDLEADASAVFQVNEKAELELVAAKNFDASAYPTSLDAGGIGAELSRDLLKFCGGQFKQAHTFPLVSETDLFGVLVVFYIDTSSLDEVHLALAEAFVQLSAIAASKADRHLRLKRAYADLQASQEIMARAEKLRALGQMSAIISHDLRNLLAPLSFNAHLLKMKANDPETVLKLADQLEKMAQRGVDTTERIRDFSRQSPEQLDAVFEEIVRIDDLVNEALELCRPKLYGAIKLQRSLTNPPPIKVRTSEFVTAIINLVVNATDAMAGRGTLTLESGTAGENVWVKVSDTGPGMTEEIKKRCFEPFFTSKGKEGTGLGLAMIYSFVQRQGGEITLESEPGQGTTFTLSLPMADEQSSLVSATDKEEI